MHLLARLPLDCFRLVATGLRFEELARARCGSRELARLFGRDSIRRIRLPQPDDLGNLRAIAPVADASLLRDLFGPPLNNEIAEIMLHACVMNWLDKIQFTLRHRAFDSYFFGTVYCLRIICMNGHLDLAHWWCTQFRLDSALDATNKDAILFGACGGGHLPVAKWAVAHFKFAKLPYGALRDACEHGHLPTAQWLADYFTLSVATIRSEVENALHVACLNGHLATAQWLVDHFGITADRRSAVHDSVYAASAGGHIPIMQWLMRRFEIAADDMKVWAALHTVCHQGRLDVALWLADELKITSDDVRENSCWALQSACEGGHIEVAQWLVERFGLTTDDMYVANALYRACACDALDLARWLATFGLTTEHVRDEYTSALRIGCKRGHLDIVQWLVSRFEITTEFVRSEDESMLLGACVGGHLDVAQWLTERFGLTVELDVRPHNILRQLCENNQLDAAKWLTARFALTAADTAASDTEPDLLRYARDYGMPEFAAWLVEQFGLDPELSDADE